MCLDVKSPTFVGCIKRCLLKCSRKLPRSVRQWSQVSLPFLPGSPKKSKSGINHHQSYIMLYQHTFFSRDYISDLLFVVDPCIDKSPKVAWPFRFRSCFTLSSSGVPFVGRAYLKRRVAFGREGGNQEQPLATPRKMWIVGKIRT